MTLPWTLREQSKLFFPTYFAERWASITRAVLPARAITWNSEALEGERKGGTKSGLSSLWAMDAGQVQAMEGEPVQFPVGSPIPRI
jgi:hypothetical protein